MNKGLFKGTSDNTSSTPILQPDIEEFEVVDTKDFKIGTLVELDVDGNPIEVVDGTLVNGCSFNDITGIQYPNYNKQLYLGNKFYVCYSWVANKITMYFYKKLKSGKFELSTQYEIATTSIYVGNVPYLIREAVDTSEINVIQNGRHISEYEPFKAFFYLMYSAGVNQDVIVFSFDTLTNQVSHQLNSNPFVVGGDRADYNFANRHASVLLEQTLDIATSLVPVFKLFVYFKGTPTNSYLALIEVRLNLQMAIVGTPIIDNNVGSPVNTFTVLGHSSTPFSDSSIPPLNNNKGFYAIRRVALSFTSSAPEYRLQLFSILSNVITTGASVLAGGFSGGSHAGGCCALTSEEVVTFDDSSTGINIFNVSSSGNSISLTQALEKIVSDKTVAPLYTYNEPSECCIVKTDRLSNTFLIRSYSNMFNGSVGSFCFPFYAMFSVVPDSPYRLLHLGTFCENEFNRSTYVTGNDHYPRGNVNDFSMMQTEDGITLFDMFERLSSPETTPKEGGILKHYNFVNNPNITESRLLSIKTRSKLIMTPAVGSVSTGGGELNSGQSIVYMGDANNCLVVDDNSFLIAHISEDRTNSLRLYVQLGMVTPNGSITMLNGFSVYGSGESPPLVQSSAFCMELVNANKLGRPIVVLVCWESSTHVYGRTITFNDGSVSPGSTVIIATNCKLLKQKKIVKLNSNQFAIMTNNTTDNRIHLITVNNGVITNITLTNSLSGVSLNSLIHSPMLNTLVLARYVNDSSDSFLVQLRAYQLIDNTTLTLISDYSAGTNTVPNSGGQPLVNKLFSNSKNKIIFHEYGLGETNSSPLGASQFRQFIYKLYNAYLGPVLNWTLFDNKLTNFSSYSFISNLNYHPYTNVIYDHIKLSGNRFAIAVMKGESKTMCLEVFEDNGSDFKCLYSEVIWVCNTSAHFGNVSDFGRAKAINVQLFYINGVIHYFIVLKGVQSNAGKFCKWTYLKGKVTPRVYLGVVCEVRSNSILVTKKPFKVNLNKNSLLCVTTDGCKQTPVKKQSLLLSNALPIFDKESDFGVPYAIVDQNNILRYIGDPEFQNNKW